jgi:sugar fermentation stimulation protein A
MQFDAPLIPATLVRREKRFLAHCLLEDGRAIVAHCPNTGSMLGCAAPGSRVWLSESDRPGRKYRHTWEIVEVAGVAVGIHTGRSNALVAEALGAGHLGALAGYPLLRREVRYGDEGSRIDLLLEGGARPACYVEVKNVTAAVADRIACFPDARTERGEKHLRELARMVAAGHRAAVVFAVQRIDADAVRPADEIDPAYGAALRLAAAQGVELIAARWRVSETGIAFSSALPVLLD